MITPCPYRVDATPLVRVRAKGSHDGGARVAPRPVPVMAPTLRHCPALHCAATVVPGTALHTGGRRSGVRWGVTALAEPQWGLAVPRCSVGSHCASQRG